jgi:hypothetical protein
VLLLRAAAACGCCEQLFLQFAAVAASVVRCVLLRAAACCCVLPNEQEIALTYNQPTTELGNHSPHALDCIAVQPLDHKTTQHGYGLYWCLLRWRNQDVARGGGHSIWGEWLGVCFFAELCLPSRFPAPLCTYVFHLKCVVGKHEEEGGLNEQEIVLTYRLYCCSATRPQNNTTKDIA